MEVTSVADVSKVLMLEGLGTASGGSVSGKGSQDIDFKSYLDSQTNSGSTAAENKKGTSETTSTDVHKAKLDRGRKDIKSAEDDSGRETPQAKTDRSSVKTEDDDLPDDVVADAATALLNTVAEVLNVEPAEIENVIEEMGLELQDILDDSNLQKLLLNLNGMEDTLELIMDEGALEQFETVMEAKNELMMNADSSQPTEELPKIEVMDSRSQSDPAVIADRAEMMSADEMSGRKAKADSIPLEQEAPKPTDEEDATILERFNGSVQDRTGEMEEDSEGTSEGLMQGATDKDKVGRQNKASESGRSETVAYAKTFENVRVDVESAIPEETHGWNAETENIMNQIMEHMRINLKDNETSLEMQLHPASLGTVQVQLSMKGDMVTATFTTQNETVKDALQTQLIQLIQNFDKQGVKVDAIEVMVQTQQFEQNMSQGHNNTGNQGNGSGNRRRQFRGIEELNALDGITSESITPEGIMEMSGSTVEFKA